MLREDRKWNYIKCLIKTRESSKERKKEKKQRTNAINRRTVINMVDINLNIPIISKYKWSKYTNWKTKIIIVDLKQDPNKHCLPETFFKYKDKGRLKVKE